MCPGPACPRQVICLLLALKVSYPNKARSLFACVTHHFLTLGTHSERWGGKQPPFLRLPQRPALPTPHPQQ